MANADPPTSNGPANGLERPADGSRSVVTQPVTSARSNADATIGIGHAHEETAGEKIGRFFRRAVDRLGGSEPEWRREETGRPARVGGSDWRSTQPSLRIQHAGNSEASRRDQDGRGRGAPGGYQRFDGSWEDRAVPPRGGFSGRGNLAGERSEFSGRGNLGGDRRPDPSERSSGEQLGSDEARNRRLARDAWSAWGERGAAAGTDWRDPVPEGFERNWQREPLAARDVMTRHPRSVPRGGTLRDAAGIMREENCGVVPVIDASGRLQGILTDRDIVVRGVTDDLRTARVEDVMTDEVSAVTEDEPLTSVLDLMGRRQIRRVPVVDRGDRLMGIISMADIATRADYDEDLQDAFLRISSRRSFWSVFT